MRKLTTPEMHRLTIQEFREAEKLPLVVVLDDVRSMYNVGSVFRTCDASRPSALWAPRTVWRGAIAPLPWRPCARCSNAVSGSMP